MGGYPEKQRDFELSEAEFESVPSFIRAQLPFGRSLLRRCIYCGCVYGRRGDHALILGSMDNQMLGPGFFPVR